MAVEPGAPGDVVHGVVSNMFPNPGENTVEIVRAVSGLAVRAYLEATAATVAVAPAASAAPRSSQPLASSPPW